MKIYKLVAAILFSLANVPGKSANAQSPSMWIIEKPRLLTQGEGKSALQVHIGKGNGSETFDLSATTSLSSIETYTVYRDRLVVTGRAGNVNQVVIFDLGDKKELDTFYCYQPTHFGRNFIVYVEWSPNHTPEKVTDVVLVYDLDRSPNNNRIDNEPINFFRPGIEVGFPVYPDTSLVAHSYKNVVQSDNEVRHVIGLSPFIMLDPERLVFVSATGGGEFHTLFNYLVEVDLANGLKDAKIRTISIPKATLKYPGDNPNFIKISNLKPISANAVSLSVPLSIYGVEQIIVNVP